MNKTTAAALLLLLFLAACIYGSSLGVIPGIGKGVFGNQEILDSVKIEVVSQNGTSVSTFESGIPLSIEARFGGKSYDLTPYFTAIDSLYYFKITPVAKSVFASSAGTVKMKYDVSWDSLTYGGKTLSAFSYDANRFIGEPVTAYPWTKSVTVGSPVSGVPTALPNAALLVLITDNMQAPPSGSTWELKGTVTITATLYVNDVAQNSLKQTGVMSMTIKNQPDGALSVLEVSFNLDPVIRQTVTGW